uniref:MLO-like protein n=1 Tax=Kalanchoe fedtschenkoi TaxID=63787 RepID=A0A7N0V8Y2_KALFE
MAMASLALHISIILQSPASGNPDSPVSAKEVFSLVHPARRRSFLEGFLVVKMAKARELDQTPTWAVASVVAGIIIISILLEKLIHHVGTVFQRRHKIALFEALEKVKTELMVLGFTSLILSFTQSSIASICIPLELANTMLPCELRKPKYPAPPKYQAGTKTPPISRHRHLFETERRFLAADSTQDCKMGKVPLISQNGLHQIHIFIFFLAIFHVIYSVATMMLGRMKIRKWKEWERQIASDPNYAEDSTRFRLTHETSFIRAHASFWTRNPFFFYIACFFRQFFLSVRRADYMTMRHGFITVHLAPGTKFNFQKYIKRSLEDDFKVVVGVSPVLWASVVTFLLMNVHGWESMFYVSIIPLIIILVIGTKLQAIIEEMAMEISQRHSVIQGIPLVEVSDRHFWFSWPQMILYLIHYTLFQNAFELTYFFWIWYEFGLRSCFHADFAHLTWRVFIGIGVQILCSYITLPLYALVTQMGSTIKKSIFDDQTTEALMKWQQKAKRAKLARSFAESRHRSAEEISTVKSHSKLKSGSNPVDFHITRIESEHLSTKSEDYL